MASFRQAVRRFATYAERLQAKQTAAEGEFLYLCCLYSVYFIIVRRKITIETLYDFGNLPVNYECNEDLVVIIYAVRLYIQYYLVCAPEIQHQNMGC